MTQEIARLSVNIGANVRDLEDGLRSANTQTNNFSRRAGSALRRFSAVTAGAALGVGGAAVNAAINWETAFADVRKTVNATPEELGELEITLRNMATSDILGGLENAHFELANIASLAGQLGVQTSDIDEFTESIAALVVASDLSAEDAASFAARFANVTGLDMANEIDNFVNALVALGNNSAASESDIKRFAERLAPLATFDWNVEDILGYSTAMASVGLSSELGSSNLFKTVTQLETAVAGGGEDLQLWADAAGMTAENFAALEQTDPAGALQAFVEGLSQMPSDERLQTLIDLGIDSGEQQRVLLQLAGGYETLASSQELSYESFANSNAAMEEAQTKAETAQGNINRLKNRFQELGITIGQRLVPNVSLMISGLDNLLQGNHAAALEEISAGFILLAGSVWGFNQEETIRGLQAWGDVFDMLPDVVGTLIGSNSDGISTMERDMASVEFATNVQVEPREIDVTPVTNAIRDSLNTDGISVMERDMMSGMGVPVEPSIELPEGFDTAGEYRQMIASQLAVAFAEGDESSIEVLTPIATELDIDIDAVRSDAELIVTTAIENGTYDSIVQANITVTAGTVDISAVHAAVASGLSSMSAPATTQEPPDFHTGGIFNAPAGSNEGLALLRDGEMVLTPGQQTALRGGSGATVVQNIYGQSPMEVAHMVHRATREMGYR